MKVAVTGHRPEKIDDPSALMSWIQHFIDRFAPKLMIAGGAAGVDLWAARVAYNNDVPFALYRPWAGHGPRMADREDYQKAMDRAEYVKVVSPNTAYPGAYIYQKRNEAMVDDADVLLAVWDGTSGGTKNCVDYAVRQGIRIWRINPKTLEVGWLE